MLDEWMCSMREEMNEQYEWKCIIREWVNVHEEWNVSGRVLENDYDLWLHQEPLCKGKDKGKIIL